MNNGSGTTNGTKAPLSYTNRMGDTYFLHAGKTKTGKPRYFVAKTVRAGALDVMPKGYEFSESVNGVVSVRRVNTTAPEIPESDLAMVRAELARHQQTQGHRVDAVKDEIIVFEPRGGVGPAALAEFARAAHVHPDLLEPLWGRRASRVRYDPVMKFVPAETPGHYAVHRMTYRGAGGWSWSLTIGPLRRLVSKYIKHLGKDSFYELM